MYDPAYTRIKKCRVDINKGLPKNHTTSHNSHIPTSLIGFALRDFFRRRFGAGWHIMYSDSNTRRALRAELRNHLADEINHATYDFTAPPPEISQKDNQCKCYLHKYFHADVRLTFPDCYLQYHHNGHQDQDVPQTS